MSARVVLLSGIVLCALGISGCGEKPQVTVYKQGEYQGKADSLPWQSQPFNNNKAEWEKSVKARNMRQNEYARIENQ